MEYSIINQQMTGQNFVDCPKFHLVLVQGWVGSDTLNRALRHGSEISSVVHVTQTTRQAVKLQPQPQRLSTHANTHS